VRKKGLKKKKKKRETFRTGGGLRGNQEKREERSEGRNLHRLCLLRAVSMWSKNPMPLAK
jgi:hypothetical protein